MVSPGLVGAAAAASRMHDGVAVVTLGWYLGYDFQREAIAAGWTTADEDRLLEMIGWPADGYRLYEVSTMDESSIDAWLSVMFESNGLFLPAASWRELGGFDEAFDTPGGGVVNHDTLRRATELDGLEWVMLLGEATFHQLHGGVATNTTTAELADAMSGWAAQYERIRGRPLEPLHLPDPVFLGNLPDGLRPQFAHMLNRALHSQKLLDVPLPPPAPLPDVTSRHDPMTAEWLRLASAAARGGEHIEAMLYARLARSSATDPSEAGPLLATVACMGTLDELPLPRRAQFHLGAAAACERCGHLDDALHHYRAALAFAPGDTEAYLGWARCRFPGPGYLSILERVHDEFAPPSYLEIGVFQGSSLRFAGPDTKAVGVDPSPDVDESIAARCEIIEETSGEFFRTRDVRALFGGSAPSMVFIDGLHEFPTALADFAQVEANSDAGTVVVLHDMMPLDEVTQRAERVHTFYTGDVWKMLHCLAEARPSLSWFTVKTPPSGLTFVTGLDPTCTDLVDRYDELVDRFDSLSFDPDRPTPGPLVENDWSEIAERLRAWREPVRAPSAPAPAGAPSPMSNLDATTAEVSRRVQQLEDIDDGGRAAITDLKRQLIDARLALDHTRSELEATRSTRLYRSTRTLRRLYARLRGRGEVA